jgi:hypothetical protein
MNSHPEVDFRTIWQQQSPDGQPVRVDEIRTKAEVLNAQARRWRLILAPLFIVLVTYETWQVWTGTEMVERVGDLLTIAALLYVVYRFRRHQSAVAPVALGVTGCVEFYRAALVRQRDLSRDNWGYVLPFVPGVALSLFGGIGERTTTQAILLVAFGVALFAAVTWWNARRVHKLQTEIDGLLE